MRVLIYTDKNWIMAFFVILQHWPSLLWNFFFVSRICSSIVPKNQYKIRKLFKHIWTQVCWAPINRKNNKFFSLLPKTHRSESLIPFRCNRINHCNCEHEHCYGMITLAQPRFVFNINKLYNNRKRIRMFGGFIFPLADTMD